MRCNITFGDEDVVANFDIASFEWILIIMKLVDGILARLNCIGY